MGARVDTPAAEEVCRAEKTPAPRGVERTDEDSPTEAGVDSTDDTAITPDGPGVAGEADWLAGVSSRRPARGDPPERQLPPRELDRFEARESRSLILYHAFNHDWNEDLSEIL